MRAIGADVDFRRPRRMIVPDSRKEMKFVMMKERSVPAPATPASVCVDAGTLVQLKTMVAELSRRMMEYRIVSYLESKNRTRNSVPSRSVPFARSIKESERVSCTKARSQSCAQPPYLCHHQQGLIPHF